jgi:hypothetical protein
MGRPSRNIGARAAFLAVAATLVWGSSEAGAAPTIEREVPVNSSNPYTPVADGSVWTTYATSANGGTVLHLDGQNGSVLDSFNVAISSYNPQAIGYANNRVYIAQPGRIDSLLVNGPSGTTNPGLLGADGETASRLCCNQIFLRVGSNGTGNVALGQSNKVGILNLSDLTDRYYPQTFYGAGINTSGSAFEVCHLDAPGSAAPGCGGGGDGGPAAGQLDYATDMAPDGGAGFYVTEYSGHTVTHVAPSIEGGTGQYVLSSFGSGPGSEAGQLNSPDSIRRIPGTGRLAISNPPNRRIDEFGPAGAYERSYGFGVLTGENEFETCGVDIGPCQAGIAYQTNSRSYFTQLDIVDGKLWVATELDDSIQVIDLGGGGGGNSLELKASPVKIKKGEKATLKATLETCDDGDSVQFQRKDGSAFEDLGSAVAPDDDCKAKRKVKITKTSTFQAVALDSEGATIATSPKVKVKLR